VWIVAVASVLLAACRQDMHDQPKYEPLEPSAFFDDRRASRPVLPGTVARGQLDEDEAFHRGTLAGAPVKELPVPFTRALLERGRERYEIYCSPCHDRLGYGRGMIVQRGYQSPPSLHQERLREVPVGYLYQAITNGFGVMPSYAPQVHERDRWAIVAYLRALQLSQDARPSDVPPGDLRKLEEEEG
jgi:mono/diheme cytochrome c family protein